MSKSLLYSDCKYPNVNDFNNSIFRIENILVGDYNIFISRNYNKRINNFRNIIEITGFNRKKFKISSHIPQIHDTLSYYHLSKDMKASLYIPKNTYMDTMDLLLIRQKIDKKQRYNSIQYNPHKYAKHITLSRRFS